MVSLNTLHAAKIKFNNGPKPSQQVALD